MAERRVARPRLYTKIAAAISGGATLIVVLLWGLGFVDATSFRPLLYGAACLALGSLAWEVVARHDPARPSIWAWGAVPLSIFLCFISLPFLATAVYPPLGRFMERTGRLEASYFEETVGPILEIHFPDPMEQSGHNLTLDSHALPEGFPEVRLEDGTAAWEWRSFQTLRVRLGPLLDSFELQRPPTIRINTLPEVERFRTLKGEATTPQTIIEVRAY